MRCDVVYPVHWFSRRDFPLTSTSNVFPASSAFPAAWISRCFSWTTASRRPFSSSGIASFIERDGVCGRGEYLNANKPVYCTSSSRLIVSSKSDSEEEKEIGRAHV